MRRTPYKSEPGSKFLFFGLGFQRALKKFSIAGFLRVTDSNFQPKYFFPKLFQILKRCLQTLAPETCYSRWVLELSKVPILHAGFSCIKSCIRRSARFSKNRYFFKFYEIWTDFLIFPSKKGIQRGFSGFFIICRILQDLIPSGGK